MLMRLYTAVTSTQHDRYILLSTLSLSRQLLLLALLLLLLLLVLLLLLLVCL
jgi:hypothetical protein